MEVSDEAVEHSVEKARLAYQQHYPEIAFMKDELREKSRNVYSIESIESKGRTYLPIPVSFMLDCDLQVKRKFDNVFENAAPPELIHEVTEKITVSIPRVLTLEPSGLEEFFQAFNLQVIDRYVIGKKFDLRAYLKDVHIDKTQKFSKGITPIFGNLYLAGNREQILTKLKHYRKDRKYGKLSSSLIWLMPDYSLWGRGDSLTETINVLKEALTEGDSLDDLFLVACAENRDRERITNNYRLKGFKELHFTKPLMPEGRLMEGRLELLLYPTAFVFVMYHFPIPGNKDLWAPFGFISTLPKHLDVAHKLIRKAMGGERYAGRAQFDQKGKQLKENSFEDSFPFLNYESLLTQQSSPNDEEDDM